MHVQIESHHFLLFPPTLHINSSTDRAGSQASSVTNLFFIPSLNPPESLSFLALLTNQQLGQVFPNLRAVNFHPVELDCRVLISSSNRVPELHRSLSGH